MTIGQVATVAVIWIGAAGTVPVESLEIPWWGKVIVAIVLPPLVVSAALALIVAVLINFGPSG